MQCSAFKTTECSPAHSKQSPAPFVFAFEQTKFSAFWHDAGIPGVGAGLGPGGDGGGCGAGGEGLGGARPQIVGLAAQPPFLVFSCASPG